MVRSKEPMQKLFLCNVNNFYHRYMTTTLHLIGIFFMLESYSYFQILAVTKHKKEH